MRTSFRDLCIAGFLVAGGIVTVQPSKALDARVIAQIKTVQNGHFTAPDGSVRRFTDFNSSKVLVIGFWASWCPNCTHEFASLKKMQQSLGSENVQIILVGYPVDWAAEQQFVRTHAVEFPIYVFAPASDNEVKVAFANQGTLSLPQTIIWDAERWPKWRQEGAIDWTTADAISQIRKILTCPGSPKKYVGLASCGE